MHLSVDLKAGSGKKDRPEIFLELTRSICPVCRKVIDADVLVKEKKVYMHKFCPEHGWFDALLSSDLEHYQAGLQFNKPGTIPLSGAYDGIAALFPAAYRGAFYGQKGGLRLELPLRV